MLRRIAATGVSPRTVNTARQLIHAVFNYGMRPHTWGLTENPAKWADRRSEAEPGPLPYHRVESRTLSADVESDSTKSGRFREVAGERMTTPRRCPHCDAAAAS